MTQQGIRDKIISLIKPQLRAVAVKETDVKQDESLLLQGILDSISFLELIVQLESFYDIEIDFGDLDPSEFTTLNNLSRLIEEQISTP